MKKNLLLSIIFLTLTLLLPANLSAGQGQFCPKDGKGKCQKGHYGPFKGSIKYALKNLNLSKGDWGDVKIAFKSYNQQMRSIKWGMPIKSFDNGTFNKKLFLGTHPINQKLAAKADLLETIYLILNTEQKKKFQMLLGAHQYKLQTQKGGFCSSHKCSGMNYEKACHAKNCQGKKCDANTCTKPCQGKICDIKMPKK
ncbi:MAG: hypothetical protein OEW60_03930 [Thiovulaceae bacterium]|nr:hypothetical protein [Sulfurimonadaceae bacterium]